MNLFSISCSNKKGLFGKGLPWHYSKKGALALNDISTQRDPGSGQNENPESFLAQSGPLLFLALIFFLNFMARIILAPLMPTVERDLGIGHGEAGSLFLLISAGFFPTLLGSGYFSSRLRHRKTIILSSTALGIALLAVSLSNSLWAIPTGIGIAGDAGSFALGICLVGVIILTGLILSHYLRFTDEKDLVSSSER